jgi:hypothetical protein
LRRRQRPTQKCGRSWTSMRVSDWCYLLECNQCVRGAKVCQVLPLVGVGLGKV